MTGPLAVIQADVFTSRPFAGNPAVAVLDASAYLEAWAPSNDRPVAVT